MNKILNILSFTFFLLILSCNNDPHSPGIEYMPDMYRSPAVEAYVDYNHIDKASARKPVEGTVPRGFLPYPYPNTNEGYELAGKHLKNPITLNEKNLKTGELLFQRFCVHCHGSNGEGDGQIVKNGKFPPPPSYLSKRLMDLPEGKMFHSIFYGKNLMPSHKSQIDKQEIWKIIWYIKYLQAGKDFNKLKEQTDANKTENK